MGQPLLFISLQAPQLRSPKKLDKRTACSRHDNMTCPPARKPYSTQNRANDFLENIALFFLVQS